MPDRWQCPNQVCLTATGFDPALLEIQNYECVSWLAIEGDHHVVGLPRNPEHVDSGPIAQGYEFTTNLHVPATYRFRDAVTGHEATVNVLQRATI
jgi:plastocyanin